MVGWVRTGPWSLVVLLLAAVATGIGCGDEAPAPDPEYAESWECQALWEVQVRVGPRVRSAVPAGLTFDVYTLQTDGTVIAPSADPCVTRIATGLEDLCDDCNADPGRCEVYVRALFDVLPAGCGACGDGACVTGESADNCPEDCVARCGDGFCADGETGPGCPIDCVEACGDGLCVNGENPDTCAIDCDFTLGDGICAPGETPANSPADCGFSTCGDGYCQSYETTLRCPGDCCGPSQCSGGLTCRGSHELSQCQPRGFANCPEWESVEVCELGCVIADEGADHCRGCDEVVESVFGAGARTCDPSTSPVCASSTWLERCTPVPGFPQCGFVQGENCAACQDGECVACEVTPCTPGTRRCDTLGRAQQCDGAAFGCTWWRTTEECGEETVCTTDGGYARCCPPATCEELGAASCEGSTTSFLCLPESDRCGGYELVRECDPGWACDVATDPPYSGCVPCCTPGAETCGEHHILTCVAHPSVPECGQWTVGTECPDGTRCEFSDLEPIGCR